MSPKSIYTDYLRHRTVNPAPKELMACERCVYDSGEHRADCSALIAVNPITLAPVDIPFAGVVPILEGQHENAAERKPSRLDLLAGPSPSADRPMRFLNGMAVSPAFHNALVLFHGEYE